MLCSSFSTKNCTTDTSTPKSAWVAAYCKHNFFNILITPKHAKCIKTFFFFFFRVDQLWIRDSSHTTITATSSTTFLVSEMIILCARSYQHTDYPSLCLYTDADGPAPLELPNQWLWDIIDEFIYQVECCVPYTPFRANHECVDDDGFSCTVPVFQPVSL